MENLTSHTVDVLPNVFSLFSILLCLSSKNKKKEREKNLLLNIFLLATTKESWKVWEKGKEMNNLIWEVIAKSFFPFALQPKIHKLSRTISNWFLLTFITIKRFRDGKEFLLAFVDVDNKTFFLLILFSFITGRFSAFVLLSEGIWINRNIRLIVYSKRK